MTLTRIVYGYIAAEFEMGTYQNLYSLDIFVYLCLIPILGFISYLIINKALKHYETIYVIPLFKVGTLMHSLASGAIFLKEFRDYQPEELIFFL